MGEWVKCYQCRGSGMDTYSGAAFGPPAECHRCGGNGRVVRYPSGVEALYPGGPFCG